MSKDMSKDKIIEKDIDMNKNINNDKQSNKTLHKCQRLDKVLSNSGFGSRTQVKELIKSGLTTIDKKIIKDPAHKVFPDKQLIEVDGEKLHYQEFTYIMMNKPAGVISATYAPKHRTCIDILTPELKLRDLFPAGRLDIDTEGLLLLTNDGNLAHNILSPKKHVQKKYYAKVTGVVDDADINAFDTGIILDDGYKTLPANLKIFSVEETKQKDGEMVSNVEVVLREGKYHQIKRMFEALNKKVIYLKRTQMGQLLLDESLSLGFYRELTDREVELLQEVEEDNSGTNSTQ